LQRLSDQIADLEDRLLRWGGPAARATAAGQGAGEVPESAWATAEDAEFDPVVTDMPLDLAGAERAMIAAALRQNDGNRKRAAEQLGIAERTLYRKLRRYGLS
jgi:DNA-binding NtrC family response regulator